MRLDGLDVNAVKHRTRGIEDDAGYAGLSASKGGQRHHQHEDDGKDEPPLSRSARLFRRELSLQGREMKRGAKRVSADTPHRNGRWIGRSTTNGSPPPESTPAFLSVGSVSTGNLGDCQYWQKFLTLTVINDR